VINRNIRTILLILAPRIFEPFGDPIMVRRDPPCDCFQGTFLVKPNSLISLDCHGQGPPLLIVRWIVQILRTICKEHSLAL
jgi:hypothetical protein